MDIICMCMNLSEFSMYLLAVEPMSLQERNGSRRQVTRCQSRVTAGCRPTLRRCIDHSYEVAQPGAYIPSCHHIFPCSP